MGAPASVEPSGKGHPGRRLPERNRTAAALFAVAGLLAFAGALAPGAHVSANVGVGVVDLLVGAVLWWLPSDRFRTAVGWGVATVGLAIIGFSMWAMGGEPTGYVAFFVLLFVWVGLYQPRWAALRMSPLVVAAYVTPLVLNARPAEEVVSVIVIAPVTVLVAEVIALQVAALRGALGRARDSERARGDMMSVLAHDVRSPLTAVEGALDLLDRRADQLDPETRRSLIEAALRQTARIKRLASSLLDLDRISSGMLRLEPEEVELADAARDAARYLEDDGIRVDVGAEDVVWADPDRLEQILVNLLTNAIRHGQRPIVVSADRTGEVVEVSVRDHGSGVPEPVRSRLFERFSGSDTDPESVGLGMWIVRELAVAQGGGVRYEPADPGSRFVITLPTAPQS